MFSKRKATGGRKTSRTKTKVTKTVTDMNVATQPSVQQTPEQAMIMTNRRQRMVERAKVRAATPIADTPPEVQAVKITDVSGVVYDKADDYDAMVEMYDSTHSRHQRRRNCQRQNHRRDYGRCHRGRRLQV